MTRSLALVVMLLLPIPLSLAYQPHTPIIIVGDHQFQLLGQPNLVQGVRAGDGSAANPYIISDWLIAPYDFDLPLPFGVDNLNAIGIYLADTQAHVSILKNRAQSASSVIEETRPMLGHRGVGLEITNATNVMIDFLYLDWLDYGVHVFDSQNVVLRHLNVSHATRGVTVAYSTVQIEESVFTSSWYGLAVGSQARVTVRNSTFIGNALAGVYIGEPYWPVDLRYNWWGSPSGPNSEGADKVVGGLPLLEPWLTAPHPGAGYRSELITLGPGIG